MIFEMSTKATGVPCYDKAAQDEPLFVIRAQEQNADKNRAATTNPRERLDFAEGTARETLVFD